MNQSIKRPVKFWSFALLLVLSAVACKKDPKQLQYRWSKQAGGLSQDYGKGIAVDAAENSYVTGVFSDSAIFVTDTLTSAGAQDIFLAKFDGTGQLRWAIRAGGLEVDEGHGIAVDAHGNIAIVGSSQREPSARAMAATQTDSADVFIARYDNSGKLLWSKYAGGSGADRGTAIAHDSAGNSYVTGYFQGEAVFGEGEARATILKSAGHTDVFIAKYDANGNLLWARRAGGASADTGFAIATDYPGNCFITGAFQGAVAFGEEASAATMLTSAGAGDVFVARYDSEGNLLWAKSAGGPQLDQGKSLAVDARSNCYVTGQFVQHAIFADKTLNGFDAEDVFVAKYESSGKLQWVKRAGGERQDLGESISMGADNSVYVSGEFTKSASFDDMKLESEDERDIFVAKYDSTGHVVAVSRSGASGIRPGVSAAITASGRSFFTGGFTGETHFGEDTLRAYDGVDIFAAGAYASGSVTESWAAARSDTSILIKWKYNSADEDSFRIKRTIAEQDTQFFLPKNARYYLDTGLLPNTTYSYNVRPMVNAVVTGNYTPITAKTDSLPAMARHTQGLEVDNRGGGADGWSYFNVAGKNLLHDGHLQIWTQLANGDTMVYDGDDGELQSRSAVKRHPYNGRTDEHTADILMHEPVKMWCEIDSSQNDSLIIEQTTYQNTGRAWIAVEWSVQNVGANSRPVKLAFFLDVDADNQNLAKDEGGFEASQKLVYINSTNRKSYVGMALISDPARFENYQISVFQDPRTPDNSAGSAIGERARKNLFAGHNPGPLHQTAGDLSMTLVCNLGVLLPQQSVKVTYAIAAAPTLNDLKILVDDAKVSSACACACFWADLNCDGDYDQKDIEALKAHLPSTRGQAPDSTLRRKVYDSRADLNYNARTKKYCGNGKVDVSDLQTLIWFIVPRQDQSSKIGAR